MNPCKPYVVTFVTKFDKLVVERHRSIADARLRASALGWGIKHHEFMDKYSHKWVDQTYPKSGYVNINGRQHKHVECFHCNQSGLRDCRTGRILDR